MSVRFASLLVLMLAGCEREVAPEQRSEAEALVARHGQRVQAKQERLQRAIDGKLGPTGPVMPRPDLGPCPHVEAAVEQVEAKPLPELTAKTETEAAAELLELTRLAEAPVYTTTHLLVPHYEMFITPEVDPEFKGFKPGVGRAWVAVVSVDSEEIVCVGTSSVQVTTADVQIHRRPVLATLSDAERAEKMAENLRMAQDQVEASFERQLRKLAVEAMAKAGPFDEELTEERPIDIDEAKRLLKR